MSRRKKMLSGLDRDIRDHIDRETLANIECGMSPDEARFAALRKFGNIGLLKEQTREVWVSVVLEQFAQDVRYGLRMLGRNPAFATVAVLSLALGIGVNTAVFSVVNTVLLRPLPYPEPDRIVALSNGITPSHSEHFKPTIAAADFSDWRKHSKAFDKLAGYNYGNQTVSASGSAAQVRVASVIGDFWAITGANASFGRLFNGSAPPGSVVLSHSLFSTQFKGDRSLIGKLITIDGKPATLVGVLPAGFRFLFPQEWYGLSFAPVQAFVPGPIPSRSSPSRVFVVGRLKPSVSIESALAELRGLESAILKTYPDRWLPGLSRLLLQPLQAKLVGNGCQALFILQIAGLFVLLIACANVANLLLARASARRHELSIRMAIGAGSGRAFRQFLAEGLVLALLAGTLGLLVTKLLLAAVMHFGVDAIPQLSETSLDGHVLLFVLALCLGSAVLFGFVPALSLGKTDLQSRLKDSRRVASLGAGGLRVRRLLVASELALALVLLTGAGLMLRSFWRMYTNPPGFQPDRTLLLEVSLSGPRYADTHRQVAYFDELLHRLNAIPGVSSFGIANVQDYLLQRANPDLPAVVDSFRESLISPGYFGAIGMRLAKGSWLRTTDPGDAAIVNETLAHRAFGEKDPIGRRIDQLGRPVRVIGVVADLKYSKLDAAPGPELFRLFSQNLWSEGTTMLVAVRTFEDPLPVASELRRTVASIDPTVPVYNIQTLDHALSSSVASRRFNFFLLGTFACAALLIALIGVYGAVAFSVTQRTGEIGIRMALGAQRSNILGLIVAGGMQAALWGIVAGLAASFAVTRSMASLLYDVEPTDAVTFAAVPMLLALTALLASSIPALRAAFVDPLVALRHE